MSLLAKNTGLIILSALIIFSCKEKEKLGLEPQEHRVGVFYSDTLSINTTAVLKNDNIATYNLSYLFTGAYQDPEFGAVSARAYTQLLLKASKDVSSYTSVDSVVMTMAYDYYYGDTTQDQTINVYELNEVIDSNDAYTSIHPALDSIPGIVDTDVPFQARPSKAVQKITLTNAFGGRILNIIGTGKTNQQFITAFNGISLVPKQDNEGALMRLKLYDNTSGVKIYYKNASSVNDSIELLMTTGGNRFSRIVSNRSATTLAGLTMGTPVDAMGEVYLQSGTGIRTKINFPTLSSLKDSLGNVAINRAELVIEVDPATTNPYSTIGLIQLLKLDNAGNVRQYVGPDGTNQDDVVQADLYDINGHTAPLAAGYSTVSNTYSFNISTYFHAMINEVEPNNGLIIASDPSVNRTSVNRVLAGSVKMRIYYTKID